MFGSRRRIGTPRAVGPTAHKRVEFHRHNDGHTIRTHSALPPIIREALSLHGNSRVSALVQIRQRGTCAFVIDTQVFIWDVQEEEGANNHDVVILDLEESSTLVALTGDGLGLFSVSRAGAVRFWPSYRKSFTRNLTLPLPAQATITCVECTDLWAWLGTSQGQFFHLRLRKEQGAGSTLDIVRQAGKNRGVLGRMFSWGGWMGQPASSRLVHLSASPSTEEASTEEAPSHHLLALSETTLEIWQSSAYDDQMIKEVPLQSLLANQMRQPVELLSCQRYKRSVYVLLRTAPSDHKSPELYLVQLSYAFTAQEIRVKKPVRLALPGSPPGTMTTAQLWITPDGAAVVHTNQYLIATEVPVDKEPLAVAHSPLGVGVIKGDALLVVTMRELLQVDITRVIKKADRHRAKIKPDTLAERFEAFCRDNRVEEFARSPDDKQLGSTIVKFSEAILDDKQSAEQEDSALLLHQRLEEKNEKHRQFIEFLQLSKALDYVPNQAKVQLLVHMEKMEAAMSLYEQLHTLAEPSSLLPESMSNCVQQRASSHGHSASHYTNEGYTLEDVFFRVVTQVDQLLHCIPLADFIRQDSIQAGKFIYETNLVFLSLLCRPWEKRDKLCGKLNIDGRDSTISLWNFSPQVRDRVRTHNVDYTGAYMRHLIQSQAQHSLHTLGEQLYQLDEFLLDTYQFQLDENVLLSHEQREGLQESFERTKKELILHGPFLLYDRALGQKLAERFHDYATIIEICQMEHAPHNVEALNRYLRKYQGTHFPAIVFEYFREQGRYDVLLGDQLALVPKPVLEGGDQLSEYLKPHPKYAWLHNVRTEAWGAALDALSQEAFGESHSVARRSTLLGLAKLAHLAHGAGGESGVIDHARYLNDYQKIHAPGESVPRDAYYFIQHALQEGDYERAMEVYSHTIWLRDDGENHEINVAIWSSCLQALDWAHLALQWRDRQVDDREISQIAQSSDIVRLCHSDIAKGSWNAELLNGLMGQYFSENVQLDDADLTDEQRDAKHYLERLLRVVLRYCQTPPSQAPTGPRNF